MAGRGFTLIELMLVIALIGILSAAILPEMKGTFHDALLRASSRELISVFSVAQSRAISLNVPHRVHLDTGSGRYVIEKRSRDQGKESEYEPVRDVPGAEGRLDGRIRVELRKSDAEGLEAPPASGAPPASEADGFEAAAGGVEDAVTFYPDGTAEAAELRLHDPDGFGLALRVDPVTARVLIVELGRQ